MADRFDNSRARRPATDGAMRHDDQLSEDDPLAELARIVASNESFDQILGSRNRQPAREAQAPAEPPRAPQPQRDISFDLEAELLNDLQSSFDPTRRLAQAPQPRVAQPAPRAPERAEAPLRATRDATPAPRSMPPIRDAGPVRAPEPPRGPSPARAPQPQREAPIDLPEFIRASQSQVQQQPQAARRQAPPQQPEPDYYADQDYADDYLEEEEFAGYDDGNGGYDAEGEYEPERPRRSYKLLITAAVVGVVVIAGVVAVFALKGRSGVSGGAPQVIAADQSPTKIQPPASQQQPATDSQQNKLIYDRADPDKGSPETLQVPDQNSAASDVAQSNESEASREISRIILPGGPDQGSGQDTAANDGSDSGPRKVRTVVVKPDGTIVSSEAAPRGTNAPGSAAMTQPSAPQPTGDAATGGGDAAPAVIADNSAPAAPAADAGASAKDGSQLAPMSAAPAAPQADDAAPLAADDASASPASAPAETKAPAARAAAAATGGYVVQLTAQRSEAAAGVAYKALQKKYPSLLGNQDPNVVKADLGSKGIYYRVRVGPMPTREEAASFCDKLTAAGGQCLVQKN